MKTVYLSLGANLGDRAQNLRDALARLDAAGILVRRVSSIYETEPMEVLDQPWFLNLAVECETELRPMQLLWRVHKIERELGRKRIRPKGPRTIDIDILFYGEAVIDAPALKVPHPRLAERRFVLEPLAEIAPNLRHPVTRRRVKEMLPAASGKVIRRA